MVDIVIGILMIASFLGLIVYCIKGHNLMVGFFVMATLWTVLALAGNALSPADTMEGVSALDALVNVYQDGPAYYASSVLVNVFFGAFFGRVLMDTGIAATLIRKVVELGGDRPALTMALLCVATSLCFTAMSGVGPVMSIGIIVLPIMLSLGIPKAIALFAFMGAIMAGILVNVTNFLYHYGQLGAMDARFATQYSYNDYFPIAVFAMAVALAIVVAVCCVLLKKGGASHAWAAPAAQEGAVVDAPWYSWIAVVLPVILVVTVNCPIILSFCAASLYALLMCGKLRGGFVDVCSMMARQFADGAVDVAPMVGFLLTLAMFNNAAVYAAPYFRCIIGDLIPTSTLGLSALFAVILPLSFFRGPTNLVGCGSAIAAVILSVNTWALPYIYPMFAVTTIVPQHVDITQSWVAWGLGYSKVSSRDFMKMSIPTAWFAGALLCMCVYLFYGGLAA